MFFHYMIFFSKAENIMIIDYKYIDPRFQFFE